MRRVVSLFLPTWPTDRLRRRKGGSAPALDAPLVIAGHDGGRRVVTTADHAAQALGRPISPFGRGSRSGIGSGLVSLLPHVFVH